ncbi:MAG: hypothetical protein JW751_00750 [Polyangiaceae bacterium]|nr:hypothetical protein [Polyangiaceae bacterium]
MGWMRGWVVVGVLSLGAAACKGKGSGHEAPATGGGDSAGMAGSVGGGSDDGTGGASSGTGGTPAGGTGTGGMGTGGGETFGGGTSGAGGSTSGGDAGAPVGGAGFSSGGDAGRAGGGDGNAPAAGGSVGDGGHPAAGRGGESGAGSCEPRSCAELLLNCGIAVDNCGGPLDCGTCPTGYECGVTGVANVCGAVVSAPNCREGWCWTRRGAFAGDFTGVVGFASDDVWFAGANGTLWHWDGTALADASVPGEHQRYVDLWASSPNALYIAARDGIRRFDGETLHREDVPSLSSSNWLRRVWGAGADVWAATWTSIFHREGGAWVETGPSGGTILNGWASGPDDVWVVGGSASVPFVSHFDGADWETMDVGATTGYARAVTGTGPDDVYVVANGALYHYDGSTWAELAPRIGAEPEAAWIDAEGTLWAAGSNGLMRWDGAAWDPEEVPTGAELSGLWGTGGELWVTGRWGTLLHRADDRWTRLAAAGVLVGTTRGVSASAADDVWATNGLMKVLHYDGTRWGSLPNPFYCSYSDIWVGARGRPWLVGDWLSPDDGPCVVEWDGARWVDHSVGLDVDLGPHAVWGQSPDDVWVGGSGLAHWNGQDWTPHENPLLILDLSGSASDRVVAVGAGVDDDELRWDGTSWTPGSTQLFPLLLSPHFVNGVWVTPTTSWVAAQDGLVGRNGSAETTPSTSSLGGIHGAGDGDAVRVWTFEDTSAGRVLERVGETWRFAATPRRRDLSGVWATSESEAWFVGTSALIHYDAGRYSDVDGLPLWWLHGFSALSENDVWAAAGDFVAHWDGGDWTEQFAAPRVVRAVYAADSTHVYAGTELSGYGEFYRFDGRDWTEVWSSGYWGILAIQGFGPNDVWFAGDGSSAVDKIAHFDGTTVNDDFGGAVSHGFTALWGASPSDLWAGGEGVVVRYDGSGWATQPSPTTSVIASIWGADSDDVWVVGGESCELYRLDGDDWTSQTIPDCSGVTLYQAWGTAADDVWFAGGDDAGARLLHFDGDGFSWEEVPYDDHLYAVAGTGDDLWVGGSWDPLRKRRTP